MGADATTRSTAWTVVDQLLADDRVRWADEPPHLEQVWRAISAREDSMWTDDYLATFAQAGGLTLAALDRQMAGRYPSVQVETLA